MSGARFDEQTAKIDSQLVGVRDQLKGIRNEIQRGAAGTRLILLRAQMKNLIMHANYLQSRKAFCETNRMTADMRQMRAEMDKNSRAFNPLEMMRSMAALEREKEHIAQAVDTMDAMMQDAVYDTLDEDADEEEINVDQCLRELDAALPETPGLGAPASGDGMRRHAARDPLDMLDEFERSGYSR